jgi:soluble lytic murein transglycosylase
MFIQRYDGKLAILFLMLFWSFGSYASHTDDYYIEKYDKWKVAVSNSANSSKVFAFFYNNPHWPLFEESVKTAEQNINQDVSDSMLLKWFKRYPPKTSEGVVAYINCLLRNDPEFAKIYIKQTWIFQNLSPKFLVEFRNQFKERLSPVDDANKAKRLINSLKIKQLIALKEITVYEISQYISAFLNKYVLTKTNGYSKSDLQNIDKKHAIIQRLIERERYKAAADILTLNNNGEEKLENAFFNQRRSVAFSVLRLGKPKLAYDVMKAYKINPSGKDERIAKAEWMLGYVSYKFLKKYKQAAAHFEKAYANSKNRIRLGKNAFWLAEVHTAKGDPLLALDWYKKAAEYYSTFYGYVANERVKSIEKTIDSDPFENPIIPKEAEMVFYNRELTHVLLLLKDRSMSKYFYRQLIREIDDPNEEMLLLNIASANDELDVLISENSLRQHYFSNKRAYKTLSDADMRYVSAIDGSPCFTSLTHAIIHRESNFNENAQSSAGAIGLMQIMPATARYEAKRIKFYGGQESLFDRRKNITIGSAILNRLLKKYQGNLVYAIMAYNCGEGNVAKYKSSVKNLKNLSPLDLMELIPIKETRIYVKHVMRAVFTYAKIFSASNCYNCDSILNSK